MFSKLVSWNIYDCVVSSILHIFGIVPHLNYAEKIILRNWSGVMVSKLDLLDQFQLIVRYFQPYTTSISHFLTISE